MWPCIDERAHLRGGIERVTERDGGGDAADGLQQRFAYTLSCTISREPAWQVSPLL